MRDTKRSWRNRIPMLFMLPLATAVLVVAAVLSLALLRYDAATHPQGELRPIAIEGVYSEEGGPWTPLTDTTTFQNLTLRDITLRGHFTRAIPEGENLYLNLDHIQTAQRHDAFVITIADDGVGFQPTEPPQRKDGRSHIGIENTRVRLQLLCGGSLGIESQEGVGTRVDLILPKRSPRDENYCGG